MRHLKNHRVLESRDPDETQTMIKDLTSPHKVVLKGDQSAYEATISAAPLHQLQIVHYGFGDVEMDVISPEEDADALLLLMFDSGSGRATHGQAHWEISPGAGIMRDIRKPLRSEQRDLGGFVIMLPKDRLRRQAQALLGDEALRTELVFDPVVDFTTPEAKLLRGTVEYIATALDGPLREPAARPERRGDRHRRRPRRLALHRRQLELPAEEVERDQQAVRRHQHIATDEQGRRHRRGPAVVRDHLVLLGRR